MKANSDLDNHVLDLGFDSPVMVAPDFLCHDCCQAVYVTPSSIGEMILVSMDMPAWGGWYGAASTPDLDIFCSCGKPTLTPLQIRELKAQILDGTAKLEEVF